MCGVVDILSHNSVNQHIFDALTAFHIVQNLEDLYTGYYISGDINAQYLHELSEHRQEYTGDITDDTSHS